MFNALSDRQVTREENYQSRCNTKFSRPADREMYFVRFGKEPPDLGIESV